MKLLLASGNTHKKEEISAILSPHSVVLPEEKGLQFHYEETGDTYFANAYGKAMELFNTTGKPVLADDSGLSVPALGGEPGIFSARYGSDIYGRKLLDWERNSYLLQKLEQVENREAYFVCCMVLILEPYRFFTSQETVHGVITRKPSGKGGFGYDPVFFLPDKRKTVAELTPAEKHEISHRGKAGRGILSILNTITQ